MRTQTRPRGSLGGRHLRKNRNFRGLRPAERRLFFYPGGVVFDWPYFFPVWNFRAWVVLLCYRVDLFLVWAEVLRNCLSR